MKNTIYLDSDFNFLLLENEEEDNGLNQTKIYINIPTSDATNQALDISVAGGAPVTESIPSETVVNFELSQEYWADNDDVEITPKNDDITGDTITIHFPETFTVSAALNYTADDEFEIIAQDESFAEEGSGSGSGSGGGSSFDFVEIIRNIGYRLLDEPTNVSIYYDENSGDVKIKWTDPDDITESEPVPATWAGTVIIRNQSKAPIHKWDGDLIIDSTVKNAHKNAAISDGNITENTAYYYGIFPYDERGWYRYTKVLKIFTGEEPPVQIFDFGFEGNIVQTFEAPETGVYLLEVWGASGGHSDAWESFKNHSFGGYAQGKIQLTQGETLYIFVGGQGERPQYGGVVSVGGINGGGNAGVGYYSNYAGGGGGGGATHIATADRGVLANYDQHRDEVVIVAGGGGGTAGDGWGMDVYPQGANCGGGFEGNNGYTSSLASQYPYGGKQNSGYLFGQGEAGGNGQYGSGAGEGRGGGGGGWYGGNARGNVSGNGTNACGGGGSGYINTTLLTDAHMAGYHVSISGDTATKTISASEFSDLAITDSAKSGNGFARITLVQE